jgi:hypothetical protein
MPAHFLPFNNFIEAIQVVIQTFKESFPNSPYIWALGSEIQVSIPCLKL